MIKFISVICNRKLKKSKNKTMPTKTKSKTTRSTGVVVNVPQSVLSKIDRAERNYPTNTAFCKELHIAAPKLRNLRLTKKCLSSTLMSLELSLSKIK